MASFKKDYPANFFKKDNSSKSKTVITCRDQNDDENSKEETSNSDATSSKAETSSCDDSSSNETSSDESSSDERSSDDESSDEINSEDVYSEDDECSEDETLSGEAIVDFKGEDNLISILYRQVVDDIMDSNRLTESVVDTAIRDMKMKLHKSRIRGYRKFPLIDFNKPENCCAYLRCYAICYTGLVKRMMWNFFADKENTSKIAKNDIVSNNYLKIVSLGGGPGNDLVGFCSALQEISNDVEQIKLTIVDIGTGWKHVFPKILQNAKDSNFGSFSECARKNIVARFIKADLLNNDAFRDENLSATLNEADLLFMVKFISYLADDVGPEILLQNVIDSMKTNAKFIFIDFPYDKKFFKGFKSLCCIYRDTLRYEMCFKPRRYQSASIASTFAHVVVYEKKHFQPEDSSSSEDS